MMGASFKKSAVRIEAQRACAKRIVAAGFKPAVCDG